MDYPSRCCWHWAVKLTSRSSGACRCTCLPRRTSSDASYLDQHEEALLADADLHLVAQRCKNSKEPLAPWVSYIARHERKCIETVFSQIDSAFGRTIHAVTLRGFGSQVSLTILAYSYFTII